LHEVLKEEFNLNYLHAIFEIPNIRNPTDNSTQRMHQFGAAMPAGL
jgi:hypothetical protein